MDELMVLLEFTARYQDRLVVKKGSAESFFRVIKVGYTTNPTEGTVLKAYVRPAAPSETKAGETVALEQPFNHAGKSYRVDCHLADRFNTPSRPEPTPLPVAVDRLYKYGN